MAIPEGRKDINKEKHLQIARLVDYECATI
jgi:hypothetical protein